jgi:hypothetical protein
MANFIAVNLIYIIVTIGVVEGTTSNTTLPDYEMAVGLCVNNDGVDHMEIDAKVFKLDYMDLVVCNNGAEFKLEQYEEK